MVFDILDLITVLCTRRNGRSSGTWVMGIWFPYWGSARHEAPSYLIKTLNFARSLAVDSGCIPLEEIDAIIAAMTAASDSRQVYPQILTYRQRLPEILYSRCNCTGVAASIKGGKVKSPKTGIKIVSATYGRNCGVSQGNVTQHIAKQCDGKTECRYTVSYKVIGDPAKGCAKDYVVRYRYGNSSKIYEKRISPEAGWGDKTILINGR